MASVYKLAKSINWKIKKEEKIVQLIRPPSE